MAEDNNPRHSKAIGLRVLPGNDVCSDCTPCHCQKCAMEGQDSPVWASEEWGILVCEACKILHEAVTKIQFKSICNPSAWTDESWAKMENTCNNVANEKYEEKVPPGYQKPTRCFHKTFREQWLTSKYVKGHFASPAGFPFKPEPLPGFMKMGVKTGYLWKRGRDDNMFQRRWFCFARNSLVYYTEAKMQTMRGDINLTDVHVCLASEQKIHYPNGLQLIIDEGTRGVRMIYLYAEQEKDMYEWYQSICIFKFWVLKHHILCVRRTSVDNKEVSRALNREVTMEGYMQKTDSTGRKPFRRRWFVLHGQTLMYFINPLDANPRRSVPLGSYKDGFSLILTGEHHPEWPSGFHFLLKIPGRTFTFIADTDRERQAWYHALFSACKTVQAQSGQKPDPPRRMSDQEIQMVPKTQRKSLPLPEIPVPRTSSPSPDNRTSMPSRIAPSPPPITDIRRKVSEGTIAEEEEPLYQRTERKPIPSPRAFDPDYLKPVTRESDSSGGAPSVPPRPPHTLSSSTPIDSGLGTEIDSEPNDYLEVEQPPSDSDDSYVEMETVPVICVRVDTMGTSIKSHGFCLRIPQNSLDIEPGQKCFLSVTPRSCSGPGEDDDEGKEVEDKGSESLGVNALGEKVVECRSFNYNKPLLKPLQLEIPHCAIVRDLADCRVKMWHKKPYAETNETWREILDTNLAVSCRVKQRCLQVTTLHLGSFAFLLEGSGVTGKTMQMAVFMKPSTSQDTLSANVYLFNNMSSDSVWTDIEEKEGNNNAILSDVSTSFSVLTGSSDLSLEIHSLDGLGLPEDQPRTVPINPKDLWQNSFVQFRLKFNITSNSGKASVTFHNGEGREDVLFSYLSEEHGHYITFDEEFIRRMESPQSPSHPLVPGEDPYRHLDFYPPPARHSSERGAAKRQQTLRRQRVSFLLRSRLSPMSRTTPRCLRRSSSQGETSSTATTSETSGSSSDSSTGSIPCQLKEDLSVMLDDYAAYGNDWSMLANYVGLEHLMHRFLNSRHPTITVLTYCERLNISLQYLEQAMRDIDRQDAASLIKSYIARTDGTGDRDEDHHL
ncbi:uncharacterized protein [Diadema antillarum]|uniref:uncharacterized protein n=1 Tax=Diadema antillarum TaxID=105358 RepID=UPI003A86B2AE